MNYFLEIHFLYEIVFSYIITSKVSSTKRYQKNKERLQKSPQKGINVFPNKKKRQYGCETDIPEDKKQRLTEHRKKV